MAFFRTVKSGEIRSYFSGFWNLRLKRSATLDKETNQMMLAAKKIGFLSQTTTQIWGLKSFCPVLCLHILGIFEVRIVNVNSKQINSKQIFMLWGCGPRDTPCDPARAPTTPPPLPRTKYRDFWGWDPQ